MWNLKMPKKQRVEQWLPDAGAGVVGLREMLFKGYKLATTR